ncbi:ribonuclease Z [Sporocytophaga myxococcoides]|uniref:Ribonuclease Z n=1 Tax=Sporocytophaga myxococcoides TaxID=153721 RepID=A0A098LL05_9BACT|nr:ribonuclease Z [Sporocytophaga myxococcoides]GAL87686.1 ribonuclease Z [Sporocytophaga myxococcoides]
MPFEIKILGSSSATPVFNRHHSSQLLTINNQLFLIDCGEGTQLQLIKYKIRFTKINYIFISHLHGDHYLGLVGLLSTMHLNGRTKDLYLFGPPGLDEIITIQLKHSETFLNFKIIFTELDTTTQKVILDLENLTVETIPLIHRINCCGFLFKEKPKKRKIDKTKIPDHVTPLQIIALKEGEDVIDKEGNLLKSEQYTFPARKSRSYAYCSDTAYNPGMFGQIKGVDMLYHEATFLHDMESRAKETYHSTTLQAAWTAKETKVKTLLLGHFSARYKDIEPHLAEARTIFQNSFLAEEGLVFTIDDEPL